MEQHTNKKRIEYIDAMRGFTMLLVVYSHILFYGYNDILSDSTTFNRVFVLFRMPLFFFVSGFVLYKENVKWKFSYITSFLRKKFMVQIVSTLLFLILYVNLFNQQLWPVLVNGLKSGYWFTITLFEYFVIYTALNYLFYVAKLSSRMQSIILIISSVAIYNFSTPTVSLSLLHMNEVLHGLLGITMLQYYFFFTFGILVKKYFNRFQNLLENRYFIAIVIIAFFLIALYFVKNGISANAAKNHAYLIILGLTGIVVVFAFFRKFQTAFTQEKRLGRTLQYIGKRTLDIYLLHYFFLPMNLQEFGNYFAMKTNPTLEFFFSLFLATLVIALSLMVSNILRTSDLLEHYLFGVKRPVEKQK